jgi:muramidase (phage lysozyme)
MTKNQKILAALGGIFLLTRISARASTGGGVSTGNLAAFLKMIQYTEGTFNQPNPYAVCYGYSHTIQNFNDHPANTGEWTGKVLPNSYCANVGLPPGCKSTAAGAYQFLRPTWNSIKNSLGGIRFDKAGQDAGAVELIRGKNALTDVNNGNLYAAIQKCNTIWASLPGSPYGQPTKTYAQCEKFYIERGGRIFA